MSVKSFLQYLWEQFRDELCPHSFLLTAIISLFSAQQKSNMSFKKFWRWQQLPYSYLLCDFSYESGKDRNWEQTPPTWSSSQQRQVSDTERRSRWWRLLILALWAALLWSLPAVTGIVKEQMIQKCQSGLCTMVGHLILWRLPGENENCAWNQVRGNLQIGKKAWWAFWTLFSSFLQHSLH